MSEKSSADSFTVPNGPSYIKAPTVSEAIELIGVGKVQKYAVLATTLCLLNYLLDVIGIGMIIPAATCELQLETIRKGLLVSAPFLGLMITGHLWGYLIDTFGRKSTGFYSITTSITLNVIAALTPNFWAILVLRLLSGMANGGSNSAMYPYVGELLTNAARPKLMMLIGYSVSAGMFITSSVGWLMHNYGHTIYITESYFIAPWRQQIILLVIPGVICATIVSQLPETPSFLASQGRMDEALESLRFIHQKNCNGKSTFPIMALTEESVHDVQKRSILSLIKSFLFETKTLFQRPYLWPMLGICFIQYVLFTVGAAFAIWYPELTNRLSSHAPGTKICDIFTTTHMVNNATIPVEVMTIDWDECTVNIKDKMYIDNMIIGVGYLVSNAAFHLFSGKIRIVVINAVSMSISCISALLLPSLTNQLAMVICFTVFIIGSGGSIHVISVLVVDIFPACVTGMALAIELLVGRMGTFIGSNGFGVLLETNCEAVMYGTASLIGLAVVCLLLLPNKITIKN